MMRTVAQSGRWTEMPSGVHICSTSNTKFIGHSICQLITRLKASEVLICKNPFQEREPWWHGARHRWDVRDDGGGQQDLALGASRWREPDVRDCTSLGPTWCHSTGIVGNIIEQNKRMFEIVQAYRWQHCSVK